MSTDLVLWGLEASPVNFWSKSDDLRTKKGLKNIDSGLKIINILTGQFILGLAHMVLFS